VLEPLFEDFQDQVFEESNVFFSGQQDKCPLSLCTYCVPVYSIVCRNCMIGVSLCTPMLETTRTCLIIPWKTRSVEWLGYFLGRTS
jgi:hypothetical protein